MPLPGHFVDMIGVRTPDDALFLADSLFSEAIMAKYPLFFLYDVGQHQETLTRLADTRAAHYIPSHAAPSTDIRGLVEANLRRLDQTLALIESCCAEPVQFDDVLTQVCAACAITLDASQYVLVGSTVRSMLAFLAERGRVEMRCDGVRVLWARAAAASTT